MIACMCAGDPSRESTARGRRQQAGQLGADAAAAVAAPAPAAGGGGRRRRVGRPAARVRRAAAARDRPRATARRDPGRRGPNMPRPGRPGRAHEGAWDHRHSFQGSELSPGRTHIGTLSTWLQLTPAPRPDGMPPNEAERVPAEYLFPLSPRWRSVQVGGELQDRIVQHEFGGSGRWHRTPTVAWPELYLLVELLPAECKGTFHEDGEWERLRTFLGMRWAACTLGLHARLHLCNPSPPFGSAAHFVWVSVAA